MKNTMKWLLFVAFIVVATSASAQQKPVKLGHIESSKLIEVMPEMTEARKTLQTKQEEVQKEMQNLQDQYQKLIADYTQNSQKYSEIIRDSKGQEINELGQRMQKFQEIAENELQKAQQDLLQPIMDKATKAIQEVGKENGFDYIFDMNAGAIVFAAESTEDVLPLVKKKLGLQ